MAGTDEIRSVWDNDGKTADRYTLILNERFARHEPDLWMCLGMSNQPDHPQGFSQFSGAQEGPHLGRKIRFEDLPENVQKHALARLNDG